MVDMKKKAEDILEDYANSYSQVDLETLTKFLEQIKSEAVRELAERLIDIAVGNWEHKVDVATIEQLKKEMVGDE